MFKGIVNICHYFHPKYWMDKTMNYWPYGSHLVIWSCKVGIFCTLLATNISLKVCVWVWSPVSIPCPNYEVVGFQPQGVDIPNLGSAYHHWFFSSPLRWRCMPGTRQNERRTDNGKITMYSDCYLSSKLSLSVIFLFLMRPVSRSSLVDPMRLSGWIEMKMLNYALLLDLKLSLPYLDF